VLGAHLVVTGFFFVLLQHPDAGGILHYLTGGAVLFFILDIIFTAFENLI
jgi:hypothetical protein